MTRETLQWLHWLVSAQAVQIGSADAQQQAAAAWKALAEITAALEACND